MPGDMDRPHALWYAFLAVWAGTQLVYGAVAPWAVAATTIALGVLFGLSLLLLPGGLALSRGTLAFLAAMCRLTHIDVVDPNPAQIALARLKLRLLQSCDGAARDLPHWSNARAGRFSFDQRLACCGWQVALPAGRPRISPSMAYNSAIRFRASAG